MTDLIRAYHYWRASVQMNRLVTRLAAAKAPTEGAHLLLAVLNIMEREMRK